MLEAVTNKLRNNAMFLLFFYLYFCLSMRVFVYLSVCLSVSLPTEAFSSPHQQCDSPHLIPLLPSSVSETQGGQGDTTLSHQPPRPSISRHTRYRTMRLSHTESPSDNAPLRQAFSLTCNICSNDDTKKDEEEDHKHEDRSPHSHDGNED